MKSKDKQFTVRVNDKLYQKACDKANSMEIPLAELMRTSLNSYCTQTESTSSLATEKILLSQLEAANEARTRSDTIIMQLSKQIERQHIQIEDLTKPKSFWLKLKSVVS